MNKIGNLLTVLALAGILLLQSGSEPVLAQQTQCVTNAKAGGTANAITVPLLPCALSTNILLLSLATVNTSTTVTLQMAGYPALPVLRGDGTALQIGDLVGAGAVAMLTSTGSSWLLLNTLYSFTGILTVPHGGTGDSTLTNHGTLLGAGTSPVTASAVGATGTAFAGNTGADPTWQALAGLNTVGNWGTGAGTFTSHGVLLGEGTSAFAATAAGTTGQYLKGVTGTDPAWSTLASDTVSTVGFGSTGLTPSAATAGVVTVAGTLGVANGGTGATTLTGIPKGSGTSAFVAATAGSDYTAPGTATTWTAKQTFAGTSSNLATAIVNGSEPATISATAATGTINYDVCTQSVLYYTSSAAANWTLNLRCSSGTSLNTAMAVGDTVTVTFLVSQGASPFYNNVLTVDGGANTPKCQGGVCPGAGNASGVDAYTYAIVKTANAAFTVFEAQTQFK